YADAATGLSVTQRALTVTAVGQSRAYGDDNPPLTYVVGGAGLVNGDSLAGALATAAGAASNVGGYAITQGTLAASSNYAITAFAPGTLTVTARPLTVIANDQSRLFGDANPPLTYVVGGDGLVNGDALSGALVTTADPASLPGAYPILQGSLAVSLNYALTFDPGELTVTARMTSPALLAALLQPTFVQTGAADQTGGTVVTFMPVGGAADTSGGSDGTGGGNDAANDDSIVYSPRLKLKLN
ncbi:MBG domain-containing protein, partial [Aquabacter spiritensis]